MKSILSSLNAQRVKKVLTVLFLALVLTFAFSEENIKSSVKVSISDSGIPMISYNGSPHYLLLPGYIEIKDGDTISFEGFIPDSAYWSRCGYTGSYINNFIYISSLVHNDKTYDLQDYINTICFDTRSLSRNPKIWGNDT